MIPNVSKDDFLFCNEEVLLLHVALSEGLDLNCKKHWSPLPFQEVNVLCITTLKLICKMVPYVTNKKLMYQDLTVSLIYCESSAAYFKPNLLRKKYKKTVDSRLFLLTHLSWLSMLGWSQQQHSSSVRTGFKYLFALLAVNYSVVYLVTVAPPTYNTAVGRVSILAPWNGSFHLLVHILLSGAGKISSLV